MPFKEIEKKYELLDSDLQIIRKNFSFVFKKQIEDIYRDTRDFYLCKNNIWLRQRNGKWELKYHCGKKLSDTSCYEEYYGQDALNKLKEIIGDGKMIKLAEVKTNREKYNINWSGYDFIIDVDDFGFGKLVEIEISGEGSVENLYQKIEEFRKYWGLKGKEATQGKGMLMLKYFAPEMYKYWKELIKNK